MKKTFKKAAAAIMAVATLAAGMVGMSASAYGGYNYETYNGVSVEKYIDCVKSSASAHTKCDSTKCSYLYTYAIATYSSTGSLSDSFFVTRGRAEINLIASPGKSFKNATSSHYVTISGSTKKLNDMMAYAG